MSAILEGSFSPAAETSTIKVLLADDHPLIIAGVRRTIEHLDDMEVVGEANSGPALMQLVERRGPDIVLMDLRMPGCDGVEATRILRESVPDTKVIVLTTYADDRSVLSALRAGARGYLTKDSGAPEIHDALRQVLDNDAAIDPAVQQHVVNALATGAPLDGRELPSAPPAGLTRRESEVLTLIAAGRSNSEIAAELVISEGTVKSHINHLLAKLGARDRAQAVVFAYQHGLAT